MADFKPLHVYAGGPNTTRGEPARLGVDPTGATEDISYASGRVAVVRSASNPLEAVVFTLHTHPVTVVKISPNGQLVASGDEGGFIRVWDRKTLKQKVGEQVQGGAVRDLAITDDGKFSVVVGEGRGMFAKCVKLPSAGMAGTCNGHSKRVMCCDVSSVKPSMVATGSEDMSVGLFKGPPVREIDTPKFFRHHTGFIYDVKFSPDGSKLAIASSDRSVSVVDVATFEVLTTLSGHSASVTGLAWSKDGAKLLTSANDKTNMMWDLKAGACLKKTTFGSNVMDMQVSCGILPSGRLVSVALSGDVSVRNEDADEPDLVLRGHSKQIVGLAVIGTEAYSADYAGRFVVWDVGAGPSRKAFSGKGPTNAVCGLAANEKHVVNIGMDGKIYVTPRSSLEFGKPLSLKGGTAGVALPTVADAPYAAAIINETRVALIDKDGTDFLTVMDLARSDKGVSIACSPDGNTLAIGVEVAGGAGECRILKLAGSALEADGEALRFMSAPSKVAFSPDGTVLAIGEKNRKIKMLSVADRSKLDGGGTAHTARVDALAFSADGKKLASGGMDGSIAVWGVDSDEDPQHYMGAHRNGVTGIAFVDESTILSAGSDSCLRSWKL